MDRYIEQIADAHGINGFTRLPSGDVVFGAYRDGEYELCTPDGQLTDAEGDITSPEWLPGRDSLLALRDEGGNELYDLIEVDPETGAVTPLLDDQFRIENPQPNPTNAEQIAFISNRDRSLDLYTLDLTTDDVTKHSTTAETVMGYSWGPNGTQIVYQAGLIDETCLRLVDMDAGTDEVFINEPESEQSLSYVDAGRDAWSEAGILFTTNHETGYRELALADPSGEFELQYTNHRDKYDPQWTPAGDIVFIESQGGNRSVCRLADGEDEPTVVERRGMNMSVRPLADGTYYAHHSTQTAGDLKRDGTPVVTEGAVDFPTVAPEEITYESFDGTEIAARLYTPEDEPVGGVVKPHGGPPAQHFNRLDMTAQSLVHAGFEVLAPDFRGSIGYGRAFRKASDGDLGGDDLQDVVSGAEVLRNRGREAVGVTGVSYGGYMTLMAVGATDAFDAGASICGVVNWETCAENAFEFLGDYLIRKLGGPPEDQPALYRERSPISYVDDIDVPLLVVQGANDPRVPQSEAEQLIASLEERDVPHEYLLFDDEGHGITRTENRVEYGRHVVEFFNSHLR